MLKLNLNEDDLYKKYVLERKSSNIIGKELSVSSRTVLRYLKKYKIPIRNHSNANLIIGNQISKKLKKYFKSMTQNERTKKYSNSKKGEKHPCYKPIGSYYFSKHNKYKFIKIANGVWKTEHVIKVEKYLNRQMKKGECIHHINENRTDNRLSNLYVFSKRALHTCFTMLAKYKIIKLNCIKSNLKKLKKTEMFKWTKLTTIYNQN